MDAVKGSIGCLSSFQMTVPKKNGFMEISNNCLSALCTAQHYNDIPKKNLERKEVK